MHEPRKPRAADQTERRQATGGAVTGLGRGRRLRGAAHHGHIRVLVDQSADDVEFSIEVVGPDIADHPVWVPFRIGRMQ